MAEREKGVVGREIRQCAHLSVYSVCLGNVYLFVCLSSLLSPASSSVSGFERAPAIISEELTRDSSPGPFVTSYTEGGLKGKDKRVQGLEVLRFVSTVGQRRAAWSGIISRA